MDPFSIAAIAMSAVQGAAQIGGGIMGGKAAGKAGREEARLEGFLTSAKLEQLNQEERILAGQTRAATAGSGVAVGVGSPKDIVLEQARTFEQERMTIAKAGATKAAAADMRGGMIGRETMYRGWAAGTQSLANTFSMISAARTA